MILFLGTFGVFALLSLVIPLLLKYQSKKHPGMYNGKNAEFAFASAPVIARRSTSAYEYAQPSTNPEPEPLITNANRTFEVTREGRLTGEYSGSGSKTLIARPKYEVVRTSATYKPYIR